MGGRGEVKGLVINGGRGHAPRIILYGMTQQNSNRLARYAKFRLCALHVPSKNDVAVYMGHVQMVAAIMETTVYSSIF